MDNISIFTPKFELDARLNFADFIEFTNKIPPLNNKMEFVSPYWKSAVNFTKVGVSSQDRNPSSLLHVSIMPFAKAYVLYSQTLNPARTYNEIKAVRSIEKVMLEIDGYVDILKLTPAVLDQAANLIRESYSAQAAYHGGRHLEKLLKFLSDKKMVKPFIWKNPIKRGQDIVEKVGDLASAIRAKKLPDEDALMALAEIFSFRDNELSKRDIFTSSCIPILLSAPARGSEVFYLKTDCLHYDTDSNGNKAVGIKWYSGKSYGYEVEWIPSELVECVEKAIARITKLTDQARTYAKELELKRDNEQEINMPESFPFIPFKNGEGVEVKWSEALFCMFHNQLCEKKPINEQKLWIPTINTLNEDLAKTKKRKRSTGKLAKIKCIFERHGYSSELKMTTHQIRHLLSSIAKINGMDTELLTKWSGRADKKHNRIYNHTTPDDYNKLNGDIRRRQEVNQTSLYNIEVVDPATAQELNTGASLTIHQTEFGLCLHDYIMSPCTKHRNCITCSEQVCVKGDDEKLDRVRKLFRTELVYLQNDRAAVSEGIIGAERHYNKRRESIRSSIQLILALCDPKIPDGSLIRFEGNDMSRLDKAMDINHKKRLPKITKIPNGDPVIVRKPPKALAKLAAIRGK